MGTKLGDTSGYMCIALILQPVSGCLQLQRVSSPLANQSSRQQHQHAQRAGCNGAARCPATGLLCPHYAQGLKANWQPHGQCTAPRCGEHASSLEKQAAPCRRQCRSCAPRRPDHRPPGHKAARATGCSGVFWPPTPLCHFLLEHVEEGLGAPGQRGPLRSGWRGGCGLDWRRCAGPAHPQREAGGIQPLDSYPCGSRRRLLKVDDLPWDLVFGVWGFVVCSCNIHEYFTQHTKQVWHRVCCFRSSGLLALG